MQQQLPSEQTSALFVASVLQRKEIDRVISTPANQDQFSQKS
jgi:hypothetical protein